MRSHRACRGRLPHHGSDLLATLPGERHARRAHTLAFRSTYRLADSAPEWLTPYLWTGAVSVLGAPAIALVGAYEEIADALFAYREAGVTQFLFMGWPDDDAMSAFGQEILPIVRLRERREGIA